MFRVFGGSRIPVLRVVVFGGEVIGLIRVIRSKDNKSTEEHAFTSIPCIRVPALCQVEGSTSEGAGASCKHIWRLGCRMFPRTFIVLNRNYRSPYYDSLLRTVGIRGNIPSSTRSA